MMPTLCRSRTFHKCAVGLNLSPRLRYSSIRRLSLNKQKRESSGNTSLRHSIVHVALAPDHCKRIRLCFEVKDNHLKRHHEYAGDQEPIDR
ncbi:hypothetical protein TNCV_2002901 [Trichonephila clavipes]|nr:hypothetical protein TNCV_2002901 [Trichonephila clavipes]